MRVALQRVGEYRHGMTGTQRATTHAEATGRMRQQWSNGRMAGHPRERHAATASDVVQPAGVNGLPKRAHGPGNGFSCKARKQEQQMIEQDWFCE
jgi:hypothetical protein